jgi:hypothetical protein
VNGWLCVSAEKSEIAYAGNDGYDEELGVYYSWDSTVNNASRLAKGDLIAIWNKKSLLGFSIIDRIESSTSTKRFFSCPKCKKSALKGRKTKTPVYRCQLCGETFDERVETIGTVDVFRGFYEAGWVEAESYISAAQCRSLTKSLKDQNSLRQIDLVKFEALVGSLPTATTNRYRRRKTELAGGHHLRTVRTRKGQNSFRERLIEIYGYKCALTGSNNRAALDAAHLYQYSEHGVHHESGGLLLRRDIHGLFDAGLISVNPKSLLIEVHEEIKEIPAYREIDGQKIQVKVSAKTKTWLEAHWDQVHMR